MRRRRNECLVTDDYADWGAHQLDPPGGRGWPWGYYTEKTWRKMAVWELVMGAFVDLCCAPIVVLFVIQQFNRYQTPLSATCWP